MMKVPFLSFEGMHAPLSEEMQEAFRKIYDSNWFIMGEALRKFETEFARFSNTKYCVGVGNGLEAILIALKTLDIGKGDEVIVPSNTYIATWLAVSYAGAVPVPVEPDPLTFNMDPLNIEAAITSRTRAIIPVHLYGQPCKMDAIIEIAGKNGLFVIEDNAQAQGASYKGRPTGSFGHINAVSFYPGKNLGALGDGGAITTNDKILSEKARVLRNYGSQKKYYNEVMGFNSRLDELQAAFLSVKMKYLNQWNEERRSIAHLYAEQLGNVSEIILPVEAPGTESVYHLFVIRTKKRNQLQAFLYENGISTLIHYPVPPHLQEAYKWMGFLKGKFPVAETLADTCLSLPLFVGMKEEEVNYVCHKIRCFI